MPFLYEFLINLGVFLLASTGLVVIFGVMGIINMAQGEFIMIGAYIASYALNTWHLPFAAGVVAATIGVGVVGAVVERIIIRWLYGDVIMGLVATFGLSLLISQGFLMILGPTAPAVEVPVHGHVEAHGSGFSMYSLFLCAVAIAVLAVLREAIQRTGWGAKLRATIANREIAAALGVRTNVINATGFALGSALAGLAGALLSPLNALTPTMGETYLPIAFITVVVAGSTRIVTSLLAAAAILSLVFTLGSQQGNELVGLFAMLGAALVTLWIAPKGIGERLSSVGTLGILVRRTGSLIQEPT